MPRVPSSPAPEPKMRISMQRALDDAQLEPRGLHQGLRPEFVEDMEDARLAEHEMQDWIRNTVASNPGPLKIRVAGPRELGREEPHEWAEHGFY